MKNLTILYSCNRYCETFWTELRKDTERQGSSHHRKKKKNLRQVASDESPLCLSNDLRPLSSVACLLSTSLLDRRSTYRCCDRVLIFTLPSFYHFLPYHSLIPPGMKDLACEFRRSIGYLVSLPRDKKGLSISSTLFSGRLEPSCASSSRLSRTSNLTTTREPPQVLYSPKTTMRSPWLEFRDTMIQSHSKHNFAILFNFVCLLFSPLWIP